MTSEERREGRYQRRLAKRQEKRHKRIEQYDKFENVSSYDALLKSAKKCYIGVLWKPSVQRFMLDELINCAIIRNKLLNHESVCKGFISFYLLERGVLRFIQAIHISERVPQKALTQNVLQPVLSQSLIYDNAACLPKKGTLFALNRVVKHLHDFYAFYGDNEGYVLLWDYTGYFKSLPHEGIKSLYHDKLHDSGLLWLADLFVDAFEGDTGLGLGSEICQTLAVSYPNPVDHTFKDKCGVKGYIRYMDDGLALCRTKEEAYQLRQVLFDESRKLGLNINEKKTHIVKISHGFKFLKTTFYLTSSGKVVMKINHDSVTRQRKKLKKLKKLYDSGEITLEEVKNPFYSWLGYASHRTCHKTIREMQKLFVSLFPEEVEVLKWKPKKKRKQKNEKMFMKIA